jgi:hypothetical protein
LPGFKTEEIEPWDEQAKAASAEGDVSGLGRDIVEQVFHVDGDGLISRVDYGAVVTGRIPMAHYLSEYQDFDGVRIATKRRAIVEEPMAPRSPKALWSRSILPTSGSQRSTAANVP